MSVYSAIRVTTKELVYASSARRSDGPFRCPNPECGARVVLRHGDLRAAYFAHLSHQAMPDCYAYSGPQIVVSQRRSVRGDAEPQAEPQNNARVRVGFVGDSAKTYRIVLELPPADPTSWWEGRLLLKTRTGELMVGHSQLRTGARLFVVPEEAYQFEEAALGHVGHDYWSLVSDRIEVLDREGWTFFRDSIGVGRRLPRGAPLSWGEGYWGIARRSRERELLDLPGVDLASVELWESGWWVHRFQLTERNDGLDDARRAAVSNVFGRRIILPRPRVYLVFPAPHHISSDGSWFVAGPCDRLVLRRTSPSNLDVRSDNGANVRFSVQQPGDQIIIDRPPSGRLAVFLDNGISLTVNIGEAAVLAAPGIEIEFANQTVDLLQLQEATDRITGLPSSTRFTFRFPRPEIRELIRFDGQSTDAGEELLVKTILSGGGCLVDAGPFGWFDGRRLPAQRSARRPHDIGAIRPVAMWLLSIASPVAQVDCERLSGVDWNRCPSWLRMLEKRNWPKSVAPQVRNFLNELKSRGLA